ncbi:hypothetical protein CQA86_23850 [Klebsiella pneumoniae]|nr:hypothetical protein CQA86_23850 [Klebsiella pneumoniae]
MRRSHDALTAVTSLSVDKTSTSSPQAFSMVARETPCS